MILIGLGSNLDSPAGGPRETLDAAVEGLEAAGMRCLRQSAYYTSAPVGPADQPWFVNAVIQVAGAGTAEALLQRLHVLEARFARHRDERWQARTLDLDLLDWHGRICPDRQSWELAAGSVAVPETLILPHPQLHRRRFVLEPLNEIATDWRHPVLAQTASALLETVHDQTVERL